MFVQVIQGAVDDPGQARAAFDKWMHDLAPTARGWLGSTGGVTAEGELIAFARFESEDAARANSDRHEQGEWWASTAQIFTGDATFTNSSNATVDLTGDPNNAGFIQVIQGRTSDPKRALEMISDDSIDWATYRPDILGTLYLGHDDGAYTMAIYFSSEAEARENEKKDVPPELQEVMKEMDQLEVGTPTYFDITDPWLYSPA
jgi:hypothetical protein